MTLAPDPRGARVTIESRVRVAAQTGVEMEALTAVAVAGLTLYDMCKAVDREMTIGAIRLVEKRGGKSGTLKRRGEDSRHRPIARHPRGDWPDRLSRGSPDGARTRSGAAEARRGTARFRLMVSADALGAPRGSAETAGFRLISVDARASRLRYLRRRM